MEQDSLLQDVVSRLRRAEFDGALAKTLEKKGQGEFALLLAMLQQDVTAQLQFTDSPEEGIVGHLPIEKFNFYPQVPLSTEEKHYTQQTAFAQAVHREEVTTAFLLGCMFPSPLSLHNDAKRIDDNTLANCDVFTQARVRAKQAAQLSESAEQNDIHADNLEVDNTLLHDVIIAAQEYQAA